LAADLPGFLAGHLAFVGGLAEIQFIVWMTAQPGPDRRIDHSGTSVIIFFLAQCIFLQGIVFAGVEK
jgi:hypothetical protein